MAKIGSSDIHVPGSSCMGATVHDPTLVRTLTAAVIGLLDHSLSFHRQSQPLAGSLARSASHQIGRASEALGVAVSAVPPQNKGASLGNTRHHSSENGGGGSTAIGARAERLRSEDMNPLGMILALPRRIKWYATDLGYRQYLNVKLLSRFGYSDEPMDRVIQVDAWATHLRSLDLSAVNALEVSPGGRGTWRRFAYRSYRSVDYPDFDLCRMRLDEQFELIIADNVFEHLQRPAAAAANAFTMLRPGGHLLLSAPFLMRVHGSPYDFSRWTPDGLKALLVDAGWEDSNIQVASWGNKAAAKAYLDGWPVWGFGRHRDNDPEYPVAVWAIAQKGLQDRAAS